MVEKRNYIHENETRWLNGNHPVKELPQEQWGEGEIMYSNAQYSMSKKSIRSYEALEDHPNNVYKKGDIIQLCCFKVYPLSRKNWKKKRRY
jgi:hypothetical protein